MRGRGPLALKKYRSKAHAVSDLLPWAALVDDGVVMCKDGTLLAGWQLNGPDQSSITDAQWNAIVARINLVLVGLGNGWCLWTDVIRTEAEEYPEVDQCYFPDAVSAAMDNERRQYFQGRGNQFSTETLLFVGYQPPLRMKSRTVDLFFSDAELSPDPEEVSNGIIEEFQATLEQIGGPLNSLLGAQRLLSISMYSDSGREIRLCPLLSHLRRALMGPDKMTAVRVPPQGCYLDVILGAPELHHGTMPHLNGKYVCMVAVDGFPAQTLNGMMEALTRQPANYRWSTRYVFMGRQVALKELNKLRKVWQQKTRGLLDQVMQSHRGAVDQDAVAMSAEAEEAMGMVTGELATFGYFTSVLELRHEERPILEEQARAFANIIEDLGFTARIETLNTLDAWLGSLPGNAIPNLRRPLLSTRNLADLLPFSTLWEGEAPHPSPLYPHNSPPLVQCETAGSSTFRLNLHVGDVGHSIILGPTGAGKSTLLGLIAAQHLRYSGARVVIFDKDHSLYTLTKALGGTHIDLAKGGLALAPLAGIQEAEKRQWAAGWCELLLSLQLGDAGVAPQHREELRKSLGLVAEGHSQTMSDLYAMLGDETMKTALKDYTVDGGMGGLLDASDDGLTLGRFTCFETSDFMKWQDRHALPVLLYLFRRIEEALDGSPTLLLLEEAWSLLGHPLFAAQVEDWLRTMRKKNGAVVLVTQYLADLERSGINAALRGLPTKILLPNAHATDEVNGPIYRNFGLTGPQLEQLAAAEPKREYFLLSPRGFRRFSLALGPYALAWLGASDADSVTRIKDLEANNGQAWRQAWLREQGVLHETM